MLPTVPKASIPCRHKISFPVSLIYEASLSSEGRVWQLKRLYCAIALHFVDAASKSELISIASSVCMCMCIVTVQPSYLLEPPMYTDFVRESRNPVFTCTVGWSSTCTCALYCIKEVFTDRR